MAPVPNVVNLVYVNGQDPAGQKSRISPSQFLPIIVKLNVVLIFAGKYITHNMV